MRLRQKSYFPLVSDCQNAHFILRDDKSIQGHVSGVAIGNDQFAQIPFNAPPHQRVRGEVVDRGLNGRHGAPRSCRILVAQKLKCAIDVIESARRVNYLRHGFGRAAVCSSASRFIQACTSSAR